MTTTQFVSAVRIARALLARTRKWEAEYRAEVDAWYTDGDGASPEWVTDECEGHESLDGAHMGEAVFCDGTCQRPYNAGGRGYAYPNCIHGTSLWTDYDNICAGCEDSESATHQAASEAVYRVRTYIERCEWFVSSPANLPPSLRDAVVAWATEPLTVE